MGRPEDGGPDVVNELVAVATHVQPGRPIEEHRLDAIVEGDAGPHVQDDRDGRALGCRAVHPDADEEATGDVGARHLEARRVLRDPRQPDVVHQRGGPQDPTVEGPALPGGDGGTPAVGADRVRQEIRGQRTVCPAPGRLGDVIPGHDDVRDGARERRQVGHDQALPRVAVRT